MKAARVTSQACERARTWASLGLDGELSECTGSPEVCDGTDNDCNVATLAEQVLGAGRGVRTLIGLFIGTGIGGGVIIKGSLHRGFSKQAGELGHVVVDVNGPFCGCGRRGCIEALASRAVICRRIADAISDGRTSKITESDPRNITPSMLSEAITAGDELVCGIMTEAMEFLGMAVASISHVVSPEMVIIGGGIVEAMTDDFMDVIRRSAAKRALPLVMNNVKFVRAELREDAGVLGAAVLARQGVDSTQ